VLAQGRDDRAGNADDPAVGSGLGQTKDDLTRRSLGERGANPHWASVQTHVAATQSGHLAPAQTGERGQQYQSAVTRVVTAVGPAVGGHLPKRPVGHGPGRADLLCGAHYTTALETQPVAATGKLANITHRTAAHQLGELEDLDDGQQGAFGRVLTTRTPDPRGAGGGHQRFPPVR